MIIHPLKAEERLHFERDCAWEGENFYDLRWESFVDLRWYPAVGGKREDAPNNSRPSRRRFHSERELLTAIRALYAEPERKSDPPNIVEAEQLIRDKTGATRGKIRPLLGRREFVALRKPPGKPLAP
jgi:hypothetical protein